LKSSGDPIKPGAWLGLLAAAWATYAVSHHALRRDELQDALRLGYARPAAALASSSAVLAPGSDEGDWLGGLSRAFKIQLSAADRLKVDLPQDDDLILLETDVPPAASVSLLPTKGGWQIKVNPWKSAAWSAPSNSGGAVLPASYPANGRVAYYDLGRIWISDLDGLRMQSLQHVPLLEHGGQLYWDYGGTRLCWMGSVSGTAAAVELGVDEEAKPANGKGGRP
jgi:hypothetical protein